MESENQQIAYYIDGLRYDIKDKLHLQPLASVVEAVSFATSLKTKAMARKKEYLGQDFILT